jgi:hypothetical protein
VREVSALVALILARQLSEEVAQVNLPDGRANHIIRHDPVEEAQKTCSGGVERPKRPTRSAYDPWWEV